MRRVPCGRKSVTSYNLFFLLTGRSEEFFSLDKELFVEIVSLGNIVFRGIESDCISLVLPLFLGFFLNKSPQRLKS